MWAEGIECVFGSSESPEVSLPGAREEKASSLWLIFVLRGLDNDLHLIFLATPAASVTIEPDKTLVVT